jgi:hypothetical protein
MWASKQETKKTENPTFENIVMATMKFSKPGAAPILAQAPVTNANVVAPVQGTGSAAPEANVQAPAQAAAPATPAAPAAPVVEVTRDNTAVVQYQAPAAPATRPAFHDEDDEFEPGDLALPRLVIVQNVGELATSQPRGALVLTNQGSCLVLSDSPKATAEGDPIRLLVCGFQPTKFVERVEGGVRGNVFNTEAEVVNAGGTLDYKEHQASVQASKAGLGKVKPWYQRSATALVLIEQPAGKDIASFPLAIEGKNYALALYTMKGTGYTYAGKAIKTAKKIGHLQNGYRTGWWTLTSKLVSQNGKSYFQPTARPAEASTQALQEALKSFLGF